LADNEAPVAWQKQCSCRTTEAQQRGNRGPVAALLGQTAPQADRNGCVEQPESNVSRSVLQIYFVKIIEKRTQKNTFVWPYQ